MLTLQTVFDVASCPDHPLSSSVSHDDIASAETLFAAGGCSCFGVTPDGKDCGSYCDSSSFAIGRLRDGQYVLISEWSDSSGHGCQCNGTMYLGKSLADV